MATYLPSSNDQRDATQMNYFGEPLPSSYSEATVLPGNMMMSVNYSSSSGSYEDALSGNVQHQNSCIDILPIGVSSSTLLHQGIVTNLGGSQVGEHDFGAWRDNRNEMLFKPPMATSTGVVRGGENLQGQGLSLSLGTKIPSGIPVSSIQFTNPNLAFTSFLNLNPSNAGSNSESMKSDISPYGISNAARNIPNSKYLKAAQQLLEEVADVRKALKDHGSKKELMKDSEKNDGGTKIGNVVTGESSNPQESIHISPSELSAAVKQELQNKLTKLLSMLDEVDRRYKQYYYQMQIVVSSFDVVAGNGAAKPYTALALQTISHNFRCLRDAINGQIQVTRRSLGEQDTSDNTANIAISRLRYVDQQLRQQRAFQQFGIVQQHTWRPQRGLPENSVSILRAWLFEHFLHPYPKDSDKIMLARQTGLTRSQVSNWFINARVRLWKPMVEEMYKEEIDDVEMDSNSSSDTANRNTKSDRKAYEDRSEFESKSKQVPNVETVGPGNSSSFQDVIHREAEKDYGVEKSSGEVYPVRGIPDTIFQSTRGSERFMEAAAAAYQMSELGNLGNVGDVSLTLGLQHHDGGGLSMPVENHHSFVDLRGNDIYNVVASMEPETTDFDFMDSESRQHTFGSSHLLHDFVA